MDYTQIEAEQGVWFTWNKITRNLIESQQEVIPISMLLTPFFNSINEIPQIQREVIQCDKCKWYASQDCIFDYAQMAFKCINCGFIQKINSNLQKEIQLGNSLEEFQPRYPVYEYIQKNQNPWVKPYLMFNIDLCISETEFIFIKECLIKQIAELQDVYVSLVTFNHNVMIHDLQNQSPFVHVLGGNKHYKLEQILSLLKLKENERLKFVENQYIQPIELCKEKMIGIIRRLKSQQFDVESSYWPLRETGLSLSVNTALSMSFGGMGGRMINILSGPCTRGQGLILETSLQKTFRNHEEIENNTEIVYIYQKAQEFYNSLIPYLNKHYIAVDLFAFSLTQFGLSEMRFLINKTNGLVINDEEFNSEFFTQNFYQYFNNILNKGVYSGSMKIKISDSLYIQGVIGCCSLKQKIPNYQGEVFIGEHGGDEYIITSPLTSTSFLIIFGLSKNIIENSVKNANFQIQINYQNSQGDQLMRIFTFSREFSNDIQNWQNNFDQEAAIVTIAKMAALKGEKISFQDVNFWLNNQIVKLIKLFSNFIPNEISSFRISQQIELFPKFMYFFRKSHFVQKIGVSLDEQAFFRLCLYRENQSNVLFMIQPAVYQYSLDSEWPVPVTCELEQLKPESILLVDTFYNLLIWQGKTIHSWIQQGYHLQEEYQYLKNLLEMPEEDSQIIQEDRFPLSKLIKCHQGSPMERILKSKLNPANQNDQENENYITDDVSMKKFMDHIIQLIVNQNRA